MGDCRFEAAKERWGFDGGDAWSTAFAAMWEPGKALPTLAVGNYVDRDQPGAPFGTCHDTDFYRPDGTGRFHHQFLQPGYCALSMMFTDWDRAGKPDLRIANDRQYYRGGHEQLWQIRSGAEPREYTSDDGWRRLRVWGMGIASADVNGDSRPDYYITSMADNKLQVLVSRDGTPDYEDDAFERGITAHRPFVGDNVNPSTSWHAQFDDINNDSFVDLFVTKGNVEAMTDFAMKDPNSLLLGAPDGHFSEAADKAGFLSFHRGRGGSLVDLNMDGLLDGVVVNREAPVQLWRNMGLTHAAAIDADAAGEAAPMGNWVALQIRARTGRTAMPLGPSWKCGWRIAPRAAKSWLAVAMPAAMRHGIISALELRSVRWRGSSGPMGSGVRGCACLPISMRASRGTSRQPMSGCRPMLPGRSKGVPLLSACGLLRPQRWQGEAACCLVLSCWSVSAQRRPRCPVRACRPHHAPDAPGFKGCKGKEMHERATGIMADQQPVRQRQNRCAIDHTLQCFPLAWSHLVDRPVR